MTQTSGCADTAPVNPMPRHAPGVVRIAHALRAGPRGLAVVLASAVLLAPVLAAAQGAAAAAPSSITTPAPGATAPVSDASGMVPTRMPRPGSGTALERGGSGHSGRKTAEQRFEEANTTHDGHLTEPQAQAAHLRGVESHFAEIDSHHRGYITFDEIRAWRAERRAERKAAREKAAK